MLGVVKTQVGERQGQRTGGYRWRGQAGCGAGVEAARRAVDKSKAMVERATVLRRAEPLCQMVGQWMGVE